MPKIVIGTLLSIAVLQIVSFSPQPALGAEQWSWFRAASAGEPLDWWLLHGKADVTISRSHFEVILHDASEPQMVRYTLVGVISNNRVKATVTTEASDMPDEEVTGRLRRLCSRQGGSRELLLLTDGVNVIGLVRGVARGAPCKPA